MNLMTTTIPLKHWIKCAREASNISAGTVALSSAYIESSLRIAIALTRQIREAEALLNSGIFHGVASLPPPFPMACTDWSGCITVSLKPEDNICEDGESSLQLPSSSSFSGLLDDFGGLLDKISEHVEQQDAILLDSTLSTILGEQQGSHARYFNVDCARIFYDNGEANHVDSSTAKRQRIYSLGLVFYELFSGGELPPLELLVVASPNGGNLVVSFSSQVEGENRNSMSCSSLLLNDFASILNTSDEIPFGERSNNAMIGDEPNSGHFTSSMSNKRQNVSSTSRQSVAPTTGATLCNVSVDSLRIKGVPYRLCDLICNMIDCINGDFMGNESYSEIADVICDLQLMLDKSDVYLHDLDFVKLSLTGLEFDHTVCERNSEFAALQCSYFQSVAGSPELAIITGTSGTGKSTMANRLGNFITANGGLFLSGKFDQMAHNFQPFSAVAVAFNNLCEVLLREEERERAEAVASKLRIALGSDVHYLIKLIPNLSQIIYESPCETAPNQDDCVDAQQRLQYLFCLFVEIISSCLTGPMTLFIDDVQWADSASISIIEQLLKTSRSMQDGNKVFFLATCRDDDMGSDHSFWKMIDTVSTFGFNATLIKLECMDKNALTQIVSNLLHLSPRLVGTLSDIVYHKTKGNFLFVSNMMVSLNREGLLRLSLTRHRWEWDEEKIQSTKLPDDVAKLFVQSISTLPIDVKIALCTLSCFGASADFEVIKAIETDLNLNLIEPLNAAIAEGFVSKMGGRYRFCHDRIQEATYGMIEEQDRCLHHMNYGLSLTNSSLKVDNTSLLFTGVMQVNLGGPSAVQDPEHYSKIAKYNLIAGKKAIEMSDFSSAFVFLDHGMTFLRRKHWQDQYYLTLEIFDLAAKCALAIKDLTSLTLICDEVSISVRNSEDALQSSFILMSALTHSNIVESVEYGRQILSQLGADIPSVACREDTKKLIIQTHSMLKEIPEETLFSYRVMSDYKKIMAIKFLAKMGSSIQQVNPAVVPFVAIKIIELSIEHGILPISTIGFFFFGGMIAKLGDIRGGYRYTKLAKALLDKNQCNEISGEALFLSAELLSYIEPLQVTNEYRIQGQATVMAAGDVHWACMNKLQFSTTLLWHGAELCQVKEAFTHAECFSKKHDHRTSLYYILICKQSISKLVSIEPEALSDDLLSRFVRENKNSYQLFVFYFHKMFISLLFNNYDDIKRNTEKFFMFQMHSWCLLSSHAVHSFIGGLASFRIYRETCDPVWAHRGAQFHEQVNTWKDQGSLWNFENKTFLLEAEEFYSNGNTEKAQVSYENAISSAQRHKFIHEEALAYELAANFHLDIGNKLMAWKYFSGAHAAYFKWGAFAKVNTLYSYIQDKFGQEVCLAAADLGETSCGLHSISLITNTQKRRHCHSMPNELCHSSLLNYPKSHQSVETSMHHESS